MVAGRSGSGVGVADAVDQLAISRYPRSALRPHVGESAYEDMEVALAAAREALAGREVWHVTSSAVGGAPEVLRSLLGYLRDGGLDVNWAMLHANGDFLPIAHRLYAGLYGSADPGLEIGPEERDSYERVLAKCADALEELVGRGDVVFAYDPPTAGLIGSLRAAGARVVWRCHLGVDESNEIARATQGFLLPYVEQADAYVFSRPEFAWPQLDPARTRVIRPSINPVSPKNEELDPEVVGAILDCVGLTANGSEAPPVFTRLDGSPFRVDSPAVIVQEAPIPPSAPVVAHVASWDRLKDPAGLIECFAGHFREDVHLVVAGPDPTAPVEEPEAERLWGELCEQIRRLAPESRRGIHLVGLPLRDLEENAAIVNALERRAAIVVRKSFAEGFGLSLAEAMWKRTPVVATRVGGIQDLVVHGETGLLVDDPTDLEGFADAIRRLIDDPALAERLGFAARERVAENYLISHHLLDSLRVMAMLGADPA